MGEKNAGRVGKNPYYIVRHLALFLLIKNIGGFFQSPETSPGLSDRSNFPFALCINKVLISLQQYKSKFEVLATH